MLSLIVTLHRPVVKLHVACLLSLDGKKIQNNKEWIKKGANMEGKMGGKSVLEIVLSLLHGKSADYECGNLFSLMKKNQQCLTLKIYFMV